MRTSAGGEAFRYRRDGDVRIYRLRVVASGTEVWRVTLVPHDDQPVMQAAKLSSRTFFNVCASSRHFGRHEGVRVTAPPEHGAAVYSLNTHAGRLTGPVKVVVGR